MSHDFVPTEGVCLACGENCGLLFKKGEIIKKVPEDAIVPELLAMIEAE